MRRRRRDGAHDHPHLRRLRAGHGDIPPTAGSRGRGHSAARHPAGLDRHHRPGARPFRRHRRRRLDAGRAAGRRVRARCALWADGARAAAPPRPAAGRADAAEARMTAPFPNRKQEEWRYADLDALSGVWSGLAEPESIAVLPGQSMEQVWLPSADEVQVRRVKIALDDGASARIFVLNTAPEYGRIELDVTLASDAQFELFGANIGGGSANLEIVTTVRHVGTS